MEFRYLVVRISFKYALKIKKKIEEFLNNNLTKTLRAYLGKRTINKVNQYSQLDVKKYKKSNLQRFFFKIFVDSKRNRIRFFRK